MAAGSGNSELIHKALAARHRAVVLTGPAGCGKTAAATALYRRHLDELGRPGCLLIVPNYPAAVWLRRRLLAEAPESMLVAPGVTTFAALAAGINAAADRQANTLSTVGRHLLLVRIVAELQAAGRLGALGTLADTPGLIKALDAAIAELKRAAVEPDRFAASLGRPRGKHADLLAVYRRYQQALHQTHRFDVEGQMWLARDVLADRSDLPGHEHVKAVAVDGFTDFTPTQLEILALLSQRLGRVLITLPLADQARRERLWFWTGRTLDRLRKAIPQAGVIAADAGADPLAGLFDLTAPPRDKPAAKRARRRGRLTIRVVDAPDLEAEVRAAARAVKADLLAGAGSVAVLARDLDSYAEPIQRIFAAHGIAVSARPGRLDAAGVVRYVLALAALPPKYESHQVLAVLRSSYFCPSALGGEFDAATAAAAEVAVRAANVLGGRDSYAMAFGRPARRAQAAKELGEDGTIELGPLAVDAAAIERAGRMLEALLSRLDALAAAPNLADYAAALRALIGDLEIPAAGADHDDDALVAADLRALQALDQLLDDLAEADVPAESPAQLLARAAAVATVGPPRQSAAVTVLDVLDARALRFDRVYLLGLNERTFPRLHGEQCLIDEADRAAWSGRGVALDRRSDLLCREMLLFYLAATRADTSLTVSYLGCEAAGQAPSSFLDELLAAAKRDRIKVRKEHIGSGEFVPAAGELSRPADVVSAAVLAAFGRRGRAYGDPGPLLGWVAHNRPELLRRAAFGILATHRRRRQGEVDRYDGRIDDPALLKDLARRIPARWTFSATELNSYARCPWAFFAERLLQLRPLARPSAGMTPAERGSFCHAVLWRVMTALRRQVGGPVRLAEVDEDELAAALGEAIEPERSRLAERALYPRLWDSQTEHWRRLLWTYLADQRDGNQNGSSICFELGFGVAERVGGRMDPASRPQPVMLDAGGHRIRLAGKIDRIDRVDSALLAVDYKTGRIPQARDITDGLDLQLALYVKALEAIFGEAVAGGAYHDLRKGKHRRLTRSSVPRPRGGQPLSYDELLARSMALTGAYVGAMREGRFDALPDRRCERRICPYRQICQYSPQRAKRKIGGLAALRGEAGGGDG